MSDAENKTIQEPQFYLVWRQGGGAPTHQHRTYAGAKAEAERLARVHGGIFHVMQHIGTARRIDVEFTEVDQIPF